MIRDYSDSEIAARGKLIVFEGVEAVGKSTLARVVAGRMNAKLTFEPGGTAIGQRIRSLLLDTDVEPLSYQAEALLMAADRAQHFAEVIYPTLMSGTNVISDRFIGSSLAYQGFGRNLGVNKILSLSMFATSDMQSDLSILLRVPEEVARSRRQSPSDRIEKETVEFHRRVSEGYLRLAEQDSERWVIVDADDDVDNVAVAVRKIIRQRLGI